MSDIFIYLLLTLPYVVFSVVIWVLRRDLRTTILILSAIGAALGLISEWWYFADYWQPLTILGPARQSIEDALFGASSMIIAVTCFAFFFKKKLKPLQKTSIKRIIPIAIIFFTAMFFLTLVLSVNSILASSLIIFLVALYVIIRQPRLLPRALFSGAVLVLITIPTYGVLFGILSPDYIANHFLLTGEWWNPTLFGFLPFAEVIWYFSAGFSMSVLYALVTKDRVGTLQPRP
jgi:hypothetical protein